MCWVVLLVDSLGVESNVGYRQVTHLVEVLDVFDMKRNVQSFRWIG